MGMKSLFSSFRQSNPGGIRSRKCTIIAGKYEKSFQPATFSRFILAGKLSIFYIVRLLYFFECFPAFT